MPSAATASTRGILDPGAARGRFRLARYAPAPDLAPFVERHWIVEWDLRGQSPFRQELLNHPCVNLAFEGDTAAVFGMQTARAARTIEGRGKVVGTKFRPAGFCPFVPGVPIWTLVDRVVPLGTLLPGVPDGLEQRVRAAGDDRDQIVVVEDFLRSRELPDDPRVEQVTAIVRLMLGDPSLRRVGDLAARAGTSPRSLQRLFRACVGVSPKWILQRYRLHEAAERIADGPGVDGATLAFELGYADQAHFINDFRAVVGRSPAEYAALCEAVAAAA